MNTLHKKSILKYLQSGGTLTTLSILAKFNCVDGRKRLSELRQEGHNIQSRWIKLPSGKRVKQHWLDQVKAPVS